MSRFAVLLFVLAGTSVFAFGQITPINPRPVPTPDPYEGLGRSNDISRRAEELRMSEKFPVKSDADRKVYNNEIKPIYRESTDEEREAIAATDAVKARFTEFLKAKDTGILRLVADIGCFTKDDVVSAKAECTTHTMPGAGSSYSFRINDYRIQRLADINFNKNRFEALGTLNHGIFVYLGDVPIESITLDSPGLKHLQNIEPTKNFDEAGKLANKLIKGYKDNNYVYASVMKVIPARTYVLRSIAYRGELQKVIKGLVYNELDFDERRDVIIAIRVAAMNPDKDVTIAWKLLSDEKAPKLAAK